MVVILVFLFLQILQDMELLHHHLLQNLHLLHHILYHHHIRHQRRRLFQTRDRSLGRHSPRLLRRNTRATRLPDREPTQLI